MVTEAVEQGTRVREIVGRSSGSRALTCTGWDHPIEPALQVHLQFVLFSVPTSVLRLVCQRLWYVLFCLWESLSERVAYVASMGFI